MLLTWEEGGSATDLAGRREGGATDLAGRREGVLLTWLGGGCY